MTGLRPFPNPARCYHGEGVGTYSRRLFDRNYVSERDVATWARERLNLINGWDQRQPAWRDVVRSLGALHPRTFTTPEVLGGNWVTDRDLCRGCTQGNPARGQLPCIGYICLQHGRWLDTPSQPLVRDMPDLVAAERAYRRHLAPQQVLFDAPIMRLAHDLAAVSAAPDQVAADQARTGLPPAAVLYPVQVRFARALTRRIVVDALTGEADTADSAAVIRVVVIECAPLTVGAQPFRAVAALGYVSERLRKLTTEARYRGQPPQLDPWNLRRHGTAPEFPP